MKTILTNVLVLFSMCAYGQIDVTFQVDMSNETVSPNGVHIAGNLNGWNTSADELLDPDGDDIYTITLSLDADNDFEYKFLNGDAWGMEEAAPAACTVGGNNRIFTSSATNMTLPIVPFNGCPSPVPTQEVTFTVKLVGVPASSNGVHVAGNFNGWNPGATMMTPIGNDFYQVTATVLSSLTTLQYKYINGNAWGSEEDVPVSCENSLTNRFFVIDGMGSNIDLEAYEFETCNAVAIVLPIVLTSFDAYITDRGSLLEWETALEINNAGFEIQHSSDNKGWEAISYIKGNGTTYQKRSYNYIHDRPSNGSNYYRLKQIDYDGQFDYSPIVSVRNNRTNSEINIYPNPVVNSLQIENGSGELTLYSSLGVPVKNETISGEHYRLDMEDLPAGSYFLYIKNEDGTYFSQTIIK